METEEQLQQKYSDFIKHKELDQYTKENIFPILSNIPIYNVILKNVTNKGSNKIILFNKSIQKLLKLAKIEESDIFSFILFYHNEINLEAIGENKNLYNINYNELMNMLNYFHIRYKNDDIKIHKSSLKKIIDLCGLIREEKFMYMNFHGVDENQENNIDYKNSSNEKNSSSSNDKEDKIEIIRPKKIIKCKKIKNSKEMNKLRGKVNKHLLEQDKYIYEELNEDNDNLFENIRYNKINKNYILDSDEEDYEKNLLQRSYNILRSKNKNNLIQMNNIYNDTKDDTYLNTLDTLNNENTLSISINENKDPKALKPKYKKK